MVQNLISRKPYLLHETGIIMRLTKYLCSVEIEKNISDKISKYFESVFHIFRAKYFHGTHNLTVLFNRKNWPHNYIINNWQN